MDRLKTGLILLLLAALAGSVAWAATGGEAEVRITARQIDDGRVEFALQQRVDGEWGERILPPSRYFPASVDHDRWLNSTAMTVSVASDELEDVAADTAPDTPQTNDEPTNNDVPQHLFPRTTEGNGFTDSGAFWAVWFDDFDDSRVAAVTAASVSDNDYYDGDFHLYCSQNGATLLAIFGDLPISNLDDQYSVTVRWGNNPAWSGRWDDVSESVSVNAEEYRRKVQRHDTLRVRFTGYSTTITVTYDVAAMRDAPTWPNIVACGTSSH